MFLTFDYEFKSFSSDCCFFFEVAKSYVRNIKAYGRFGVKVKELKSETNNAIANCLLNSILRIVF